MHCPKNVLRSPHFRMEMLDLLPGSSFGRNARLSAKSAGLLPSCCAGIGKDLLSR